MCACTRIKKKEDPKGSALELCIGTNGEESFVQHVDAVETQRRNWGHRGATKCRAQTTEWLHADGTSAEINQVDDKRAAQEGNWCAEHEGEELVARIRIGGEEVHWFGSVSGGLLRPDYVDEVVFNSRHALYVAHPENNAMNKIDNVHYFCCGPALRDLNAAPFAALANIITQRHGESGALFSKKCS